MKKIIMSVCGAVISGVGKCFSKVSGWCLLAVLKVGVGVGYVGCFMLLAAGAAGVLTNDLPLKLVTLGLTLIVARVFGMFCLLLAGFALAHVVYQDSKIRAEKMAKEIEESKRKLSEANRELESVKGVLVGKDGEIEKLKIVLEKKEAELRESSRTVNVASIRDVLKLGLIEAEMTIYDFDNDKNMGKRKLEVKDHFSIGHHRPRWLWQYIGFREEKIKAIFGVDLNELHLEMGKNRLGEDVLYVHGVKMTHAVESSTPVHSFSMMRKVKLTEYQKERSGPVYQQRLANMEVFAAKDGGDEEKMWEIVKGEDGEYSCSQEKHCLADYIAGQEMRMNSIRNGINRAQFKAIDDEVIKRSKEFLKILLAPICKNIEIIIDDEKPADWDRIEMLPRLQEFCEDYNRRQLTHAKRLV